jgi:aspartate/methionine/tyrosine aminotransferase
LSCTALFFVGEGGFRHVLLREDSDFGVWMNGVTSPITNESRVMIPNHPNNLTGSVLSYDEVGVFSQIAIDRDLVVMSYECTKKSLADALSNAPEAAMSRNLGTSMRA